MYKSAGDRKAYMARTGSHSTKPLPSGLVRDLPPDAAEPEDYYQSLRDQLNALLAQLTTAQQHARDIREKLKDTKMPYAEFQHWHAQRQQNTQLIITLEAQCAEFRRLARAAAAESWDATWIAVASRVIPEEVLRTIDEQTRQWLGRPQQEIAATRADRPGLKAREKRQKRRKKFRTWLHSPKKNVADTLARLREQQPPASATIPYTGTTEGRCLLPNCSCVGWCQFARK